MIKTYVLCIGGFFVVLSRYGLDFGKEVSRIECDKEFACIGLGIALGGVLCMAYDYFEDDIKDCISKLKTKWDNFKN